MLFLTYDPQLNPTELEIYKYISHNIEKVPYMTIRELADEIHFSKTAIWRFCQKFECEGYTDFKFKLKNYLSERKKTAQPKSLDETMLIHFLQRSSEELLEGRIVQAAELLAKKEFVLFIGEGTSKVLAEFGEIYFSSIYNLSASVSHLFSHPVSKLSEETAKKVGVIALSVSGETQKVRQNIDYFIEMGIDVIAITNSEKSTIAQLSTVTIPYYITTEKSSIADVTSQLPALFLIEKLANTVSTMLNECP